MEVSLTARADRAREHATATVAAGLCLARLVAPNEVAARSGPWILATMAERLEIPPPGVVADLGALLFGASLGELRTRPALPVDDPALAAALRRYEDALLGRLAASGRLASAGFAVARLPKEMHAQAVGILVAGVLGRIGYEGGIEVEPGVVRQLTERRPDQALQRGYATLREDEAVRRRLADGYAALARGAQSARELLGDADLFALENLTVLGTLTQRLAIADVLRAEEALAAALPRRLPRRRRKEGDVASKLEDESVYPAGGFSSVTTSGSLENLVTSELIYMEPPGVRPDVDLFDLRYVEGELLYYARDEAIFVRRRRLVVLALGEELVRARVKDPGLPWQRIVLALAAVVVVTKKLAELLGDEALEVRVVFLRDEDRPTPLAPEMALADLLMREWKEKGMVSVVEATWEETAALVTASTRRALVDVVRVGDDPRPTTPLAPRTITTELPVANESLEGWARALAEVLSAIL